MKVLWLCNFILPKAAADLGIEGIPKEGWVEGLMDAMKASNAIKASDAFGGMTLGVAFPVSEEHDGKRGELFETPGFKASYYCFYEDMLHPEKYDAALEQRMNRILDEFRPDVVHVFGTEYPHTLAMARAATTRDAHYHPGRERMLITFQGVCAAIAGDYLSSLPDKVVSSRTFRDLIRKDSIKDQHEKFRKRAVNELEALKLSGHIGGRTAFDKKWAGRLAPEASYHYAGEVMRGLFYEPVPSDVKRDENVIFVAGGDYTIKGFHYLLAALKDIRWPELKIRVAGQDLVDKPKYKICGYGKYLSEMIEKCGLEGRIEFLGRISAEKMRDEYLRCGIFICPSAVENSPNSIVEASIMGAPVIASRVGGIPDIIEDKKECILFDCSAKKPIEDNAANLKKAIETVKGDYKEALERAKKARERMLKDHDPVAVAGQMLGIYEVINKYEK